MKIVNIAKKQNKKKPLKRSMTGLEVEMHIIDSEGGITNRGFELVKKVKEKFPKVEVVKECGMNMLELGCYPDIYTFNPALNIISYIEKVIKVGDERGLRIYPFGTYPGKYKPKLTPRSDGHYKMKEKIFGKDKFVYAPKATGFHHHYALPKGVFDKEKKELKLLISGKLKRSLLNSYNFEIAIDPILTLLTQSSPFYDGKQLAKDSRILISRGGKKLGYPGYYGEYQQLGGLPPYKQTETDLIHSFMKRRKRWQKLIKKADPNANFNKMYPYKLDISWNPIKVNKHGTLEQRGMDMNYMSIILAVSAMIKFCLKKIQRDFIEVIPADMGIDEPFRIKKGIMFIPPHTYVRNILQKASAYEGFSNQALYEYTKKWYRFVRSLTPDSYLPLIVKIKDMIDKRKSVSDEMVEYAKRRNLLNKYGNISNANAKILALHFSNKFEKDLRETKKIVKEVARKHQMI